MSVHNEDDLKLIAERLDAPLCLIEYLYEEYLEGDELDETPFAIYIADRIADSTYVSELYNGAAVDDADESSAEVFSEVCSFLGVDPAEELP